MVKGTAFDFENWQGQTFEKITTRNEEWTVSIRYEKAGMPKVM